MSKEFFYPNNSIAEKLQQIMQEVLKIFHQDFELNEIHLERPNDEDHGDFSTNIAMQLAGSLQDNPRKIAEQIVTKFRALDTDNLVSKIEIAGPGFINITIVPEFLKNEIKKVLLQQEEYGNSNLFSGKTVMIEYGQPNTHKAFHVGHLRSAISGLALVGLYKALGYKVIQANFYGDVGLHVAKCIWGFIEKGGGKNKDLKDIIPADFDDLDEHERMKYLDDCYVFGAKKYKEDDIAKEEIKIINKNIYSKDDSRINEIYDKTRQWSIEHQDSIFRELGVIYDRQYPESEVTPYALDILEKNKSKVFEQSDGAWIYNGKEEGLQTYVFITQEGLPTYSAKDMGLGYLKFHEYDLDLSVINTSVEQVDYFKVVFAALERIDPNVKGKNKHIPFGWLLQDGKKKSSRSGGVAKGMDIIKESKKQALNLITSEKDYPEDLRKEISDKVAIAGLKFMILSHEYHKNINYDPENFISLDGFSGPYLLYTYTRCKSVIDRYGREIRKEIDLNNSLNSKVELDLVRMICKYQEVILKAGLNLSPHLICNFLYELAQKFNKFYSDISILSAEIEEDKDARILLTDTVAQVLENGLGVLGIEAINKM